MATAIDVLRDAFDRIHEELPAVLDGLSADRLSWRPDGGANPIGWLVWHLTRVQDDHVAGVADREQVWTRDGWVDRFELPYPVGAIGYGQSADEVAAFRPMEPSGLLGYHEAVHELTGAVLDELGERELDRVVDARWDPPVTVAVRLVSVVNDITQHLGQAAYVRGLVERRR
jgi:hypothetical protein